jgi:hypothetical protein
VAQLELILNFSLDLLFPHASRFQSPQQNEKMEKMGKQHKTRTKMKKKERWQTEPKRKRRKKEKSNTAEEIKEKRI